MTRTELIAALNVHSQHLYDRVRRDYVVAGMQVLSAVAFDPDVPVRYVVSREHALRVRADMLESRMIDREIHDLIAASAQEFLREKVAA